MSECLIKWINIWKICNQALKQSKKRLCKPMIIQSVLYPREKTQN